MGFFGALFLGEVLEKVLTLNIYGLEVQLTCDHVQTIQKLKKDFEYFQIEKIKSSSQLLTIDCVKKDYLNLLPKNKIASKQTQNSLYFDEGDLRYNDYYGKALVIFNFKKEMANIYYQDEDFLYELVYLLILSRSGKAMDQKRMHKVHACGVSLNKNLILMMSSKGGKTSLFCEILTDPKVNIISDDTPVISSKGKVYPFPLRVGVEDPEKLLKAFPSLRPADFYEFKREYFNKKFLLNLSQFPNKIETKKKNVLVVGKRSTFEEPQLKKIHSFKMLQYTMEHMVVGLGLPMIVEYFLRSTVKDHMTNITIFISRLYSAFQLVMFSENYEIYTCSDQKKNADVLKRLIT